MDTTALIWLAIIFNTAMIVMVLFGLLYAFKCLKIITEATTNLIEKDTQRMLDSFKATPPPPPWEDRTNAKHH